jgi:predicted deacetylase
MMSRAGLSVYGFIAPAWLINDDGLRAARRLGLQYTNSYATLADLSNDRSYLVPSLVFGPGHLDEDLGVALQEPVCRLMAIYPLARVVLHPPCIDHPRRMRRIAAMIERLTRAHAPVTYFEMLATLRAAQPDGTYHCAQ